MVDLPLEEWAGKALIICAGLVAVGVALFWIAWKLRPKRRRHRPEPPLVMTSPHAVGIARRQELDGRADADAQAWDEAEAFLAGDAQERARHLGRLRDGGAGPWREQR